ncbi:DUF1929 domain-containing protein [Streptomyces sp. NBC_00820]|uniref:galactose oxidase early set domain-containing protein n=1 Tax=Streptomyces sp. NBC_00820 TaxID=2975842 RepID=UPI002ED58B1A|nr:DUF1929 domain-containing protein [Streptomyces sp. NBC_00820]
MSRRGILAHKGRWTLAAGRAALVLSVTAPALLAPSPASAAGSAPGGVRITRDQLRDEVRADEVEAFGRPRAERLARDRVGYNPNADEKYRQTEIRGTDGAWRPGPHERLPRGYHSNAFLLPDGRIMVTGDELQEIANNPDIKSGLNGTIEIYESPYLHQGGARPMLTGVTNGSVGYGTSLRVSTGTPELAEKAVLMAPITSTHSVDTSQRRIELPITSRAGNKLVLQTPASAKDAPPGYYLLFLLDSRGVPSVAKWVQLRPGS